LLSRQEFIDDAIVGTKRLIATVNTEPIIVRISKNTDAFKRASVFLLHISGKVNGLDYSIVTPNSLIIVSSWMIKANICGRRIS